MKGASRQPCCWRPCTETASAVHPAVLPDPRKQPLPRATAASQHVPVQSGAPQATHCRGTYASRITSALRAVSRLRTSSTQTPQSRCSTTSPSANAVVVAANAARPCRSWSLGCYQLDAAQVATTARSVAAPNRRHNQEAVPLLTAAHPCPSRRLAVDQPASPSRGARTGPEPCHHAASPAAAAMRVLFPSPTATERTSSWRIAKQLHTATVRLEMP